MLIYELGKFVNENTVITRPDSEYNMSLWKPGKHNILYITGLSGSGKSTLATKMCDEHNARYIELDRIVNAFQFKDNPRADRIDEILIAEYVKRNNIVKDPYKMNNKEYKQYMFDCFGYIINELHKSHRLLFVVEGLQLIRLANERYAQEIFTSPLIIKETSVIHSIGRRMKRTVKMYTNPELGDVEDAKAEMKSWASLRGIMTTLNWYLDVEYGLDCLRKTAKNTYS